LQVLYSPRLRSRLAAGFSGLPAVPQRHRRNPEQAVFPAFSTVQVVANVNINLELYEVSDDLFAALGKAILLIDGGGETTQLR
jgi:hypothetical protein